MENGSSNNEGPAKATGAEVTPQFFGEYEVLKTIGKGKFAVVYRAKKRGSEDVVALKRIAVDMMNDKAREKCLKEVRLLQSLDHPNIIRYMDSFITENDLMIVYEWAAAGDLKRQLRKAQERGIGFEERVVWKYFSQICNAMQHMHDKRIMHRDLKPANIFLTLDGTIKVGDLGLSRELSEHTIQAHSKVGTPLYMSPEVLKGDGYDFKSDVWSLGCLLYELAMLKSPFKSEGLNLYSLFQKISNGDFQPLPDTYSEELRSLAYSMISTRAADRPEISYVCEVSQRMRTLTADKAKQKKAAAAAAAAEEKRASTRTIADANAAPERAQQQRPAGAAETKPSTNDATHGEDPLNLEDSPDRPPLHRGSSDRGSGDPTVTPRSSRQGTLQQPPADEEKTPSRFRHNSSAHKSGMQYDDEVENGNRRVEGRGGGGGGGGGGGERAAGDDKSGYASAEGQALQRMGSFQIELVDEGVDVVMEAVVGANPNGGIGFGAGDDADDKEGEGAGEAVAKWRVGGGGGGGGGGGSGSGSGRLQRTRTSSIDSDTTPRAGEADDIDDLKDRDYRDREKDRRGDGGRGDGNHGVRGGDGRGGHGGRSDGNIRSDREGSRGGGWGNGTGTKELSLLTRQNYAPAAYAAIAPMHGQQQPPDDGSPASTSGGGGGVGSSGKSAYRRSKPPELLRSNSGSGSSTYGRRSDQPTDRPVDANRLQGSREGGRNFSSSGRGMSSNGKKFSEHFQNTSVAFAAMEILYGKLTVLGYPMEDPRVRVEKKSKEMISRGRLLPMHFACDLQIFAAVAGHSNGYQFLQFQRMVWVVIWLCERIGGVAADIVRNINVEEDTPVMTGKQILRTLQVNSQFYCR